MLKYQKQYTYRHVEIDKTVHIQACWNTQTIHLQTCWNTQIIHLQTCWNTHTVHIQACWNSQTIYLQTCWNTQTVHIQACWNTHTVHLQTCIIVFTCDTPLSTWQTLVVFQIGCILYLFSIKCRIGNVNIWKIVSFFTNTLVASWFETFSTRKLALQLRIKIVN
jgi:hypothetical protein